MESVSAEVLPHHEFSKSKSPLVDDYGGVSKMNTCVGRDEEIQVLRDAYLRATSATTPSQELVLIEGPSGTGKTSLANALKSEVQINSGFFLSGKFELSRNQAPFAVFAQAFHQFVDLLVGDDSRLPDERLPKFRKAITEAVGGEGQLLIDLIPSLSRIIGEQEDACQVSAAEAVQRLHFTIGKLCNAISSVAPVVMLLDDLQWSDKASLDLIDSLLQPSLSSSVMLIGIFRGDELDYKGAITAGSSSFESTITVKSSFKRFLNDTKLLNNPPKHLRVSLISMTSVDVQSLHQLIANTLGTTANEVTGKLAEYLQDHCDGNVFHVLFKLKMFMNRRIVYRDNEARAIVFDEKKLEELSISGDESVNEIVRHSIQQVSTFSQEVLKIAACIGDEIDESALCTVLNRSADEVAAALEAAMKMELVTFLPNLGRYRFCHDRMRQATLTLLEDVDAFSFDVGYKLWQRSSPHFIYTKIFVISNLLLRGADNVADNGERFQIAAYYLEAGTKAASLAAFPDASRYFAAGIRLLGDNGCWEGEYDLTLRLFNSAVDASLCCQDFDNVATLVRDILGHAHSYNDKITAYAALVNSAGQNGSMDVALDVGLQVLGQLGVHLTKNPSLFTIISTIMKTKRAIGRHTDYDILALPPMNDESKLAAMHLLHNLFPYAFSLGLPCCATMACVMVQLTMKFGMSKLASRGFANLAWVLCKFERKEGHRLGLLAMDMVQKHRARELIPSVHGCVYFFVTHWIQPLRDTFEPLQKAYSLGMEIGDVENAIYAFCFRSTLLFYAGCSLKTVEEAFTELLGQISLYKQTNTQAFATPTLQAIHNLTGRAPNPKLLSGSVFNADVDTRKENKIQQVICCGVGAELAYRFGDLDLAQSLVEQRRSLPENHSLHPYAVDYFNDGLIGAALARVPTNRNRRRRVNQLRQSIKMMTDWAKDCPSNYLHKLKLLEAELKSLQRKGSADLKVVALYQSAIDGALTEGFRQDAALSTELAGDYLFRLGNAIKAGEYWNQAHSLYTGWGATAKAVHLRERTSETTIM